MLSVKRPECFNGHVSPLGFSEGGPECSIGLTPLLGLANGLVSLIFQALSYRFVN